MLHIVNHFERLHEAHYKVWNTAHIALHTLKDVCGKKRLYKAGYTLSKHCGVIEGCAELAGVVQKSSETDRPATRVTRLHSAVSVNSAANIGRSKRLSDVCGLC